MRSTILILIFTMGIVAGRGADPKPGEQIEQNLELPGGRSVPYLLYLPKEYDSKQGKWPLMLFLHGRGESRGPLSLVKKWGPPRLIERGEHFPYIVVSPQCPSEESWGQPQQESGLTKLLDDLGKRYKVDEDRVYLTGLSMGGYGSWRLASNHPQRFAAVIPICGGGNPEDAEKLKGLPIWVFHGTEDTAVPLKRSVEMVEAIQRAGGTMIRFTTLEAIGHNSWEAAYASPDMYRWMEDQTSAKNRARADR